MLFNSVEFLIFFPIVTLIYFLIPHKFRWFILLLASCIFYMAFIPIYILILAFTIVIDYFAGLILEKTEGKKRKLFLVISLISNCGILFFFKYFNFFSTNMEYLANLLHWNYSVQSLGIILPIGLSFHTFQSMGYIIEVYRGKQKAERNFGIYALYVMFYPQLVAGPIERPQNLLCQFYEKHDFDYNRITSGLRLMLWGLFKKVVIADKLAILVNQVYNNPTDYEGPILIIATVFFAFQIFCDFSGYSDIAIGAAEVMGFKLMKNFDRPYFSKSIAEFWKRWHISLSSWFKDYLYIPLGGNRVSIPRWCLNLFIVFIVSGFWHGANWTFIIWGALHGLYQVIYINTRDSIGKIVKILSINKFQIIYRVIQVGITFSLVSFAWIFFRANNVQDAFYIISHMFYNLEDIVNPVKLANIIAVSGLSRIEFLGAVLLIGFMELVHLLQGSINIREFFTQKPAWFRWASYYVIIFSIMLFGVFNSSQFIYFQF